MKSINSVRKKIFLMLAPFLFVAVLTACGKMDVSEGKQEGSPTNSPTADTGGEYAANEEANKETDKETNTETDKEVNKEAAGNQQGTIEQKTSGEQTVDPLPEMTSEELAALQYVEKVSLDDYYGDKTEYEVYVPKDAQRGEGYISFIEHGLNFFVTVVNVGYDEFLDEYLNGTVQFDIDDWKKESSGYSEVEFGEIIRCGDDRFRIASAMNEDFYGTPYPVKKVYYMNVIKEGVGILWSLQMSELSADDETNAVIDEIAKCYRVDLEEIKAGSTYLIGDAKRKEQSQDEYEPSEGDLVLEKVEGYRYMGLTMISDFQEKVQCPIMIPMGRQTSVWKDSALAHMHGIKVSGSVGSLYGRDYLSNVQSSIDSKAGGYERFSDTYRNVQAGSAQPISGYNMARCAVITYEQKDYLTEEFLPRADILCYIKVQEDYTLYFTITILYEEYDNSTNILLKELETAYGIDLSEYYHETI